VDTEARPPGSELRPRVFISYSRKDQRFVERLTASLDERGLVADWDQTATDPDNVSLGISAEDEWWARLKELIGRADVMVFVVSPDSAASKVCDEEIAYARALGKRVIPILCRPIDFKRGPPRLTALNVKLSFITESSYDNSVEALMRAVLLDIQWMRELSLLTQTATRWDDTERGNDQLLEGADLLAAEKWVSQRPASAPPVPALVLDFLGASRQLEEERRAISEVERFRYEEIARVTREFLEKELKFRESLPSSGHAGVDDELETEKQMIRSLVGRQIYWHPQPPKYLGHTGAIEGYAELFQFPCCGKGIRDFSATGETDAPSQFRADGCTEIPESIRYEFRKRSNRFKSALLAYYQGNAPLARSS
jgi:hypothetical protein